MSKNKILTIERSIIKNYRKTIWSPFIKAIREYDLIQNGDHIVVCISGGKDSLLLAKLFQELYKNGRKNFKLSFLAMDPGYSKEKRENLENLLDILEIPCKILDSDVFAVADHIAQDNPCYMCARMRRGFLYGKAKEMGANKIALGHHFDDVIETILLNLIFSAKYNTMMPKIKAINFDNMELIRPMVYIKEIDIIRFTKSANIEPLDCACTISAKKTGNRRYDIKNLIKDLEKLNPHVGISLYRSAQNVNLNQILGFTKDGERFSFLDGYGEDD